MVTGLVDLVADWHVCLRRIISAIYAITRNPSRPSQLGNSPEDARTIFDQRLARGEIDDQEYTKLRDVIAHADEASVASTQGGG